jgi:hypothetical protein
MTGKKSKKNNWSEKDWEEWGERFGERMEAWGNEMECKFGTRNKGPGVGGLIIAIFIIAWGVIWLGNDMGWWDMPFPFWPIVIILIGLAILLGETKKAFS